MFSHLRALFSSLSPYTLSATLLVAGTCVGGGMLALPVSCARAGFWPSIAIMAMTWFMMTATALCLVEVGFWMEKDDAHVVSMSKKFLGTFGRWVSWTLFLFISYASLIAYTGGSGQLIAHAIETVSCGALSISHSTGAALFTALFGPFIFFSHHTLGKANSLLFFILIATYALIVGIGIPIIESSRLAYHNWLQASNCIPLLLTSFSFQTMVPSLHPYLNHDKNSLRTSIVAGTSLAFVIYALWQLVVMGSVPIEGPFGLLDAYSKSMPATYSLIHATSSPFLGGLAVIFAFLSLVTSFFGISMGLYDFLSDGLKIEKRGTGSIALGLLVLIPSLLAAMYYEGVFLTALDLSGAFGDTILNGLIPIAMLWTGWSLYKRKKLQKRMKLFLLLIGLLYAFALSAELYSRITPLAAPQIASQEIASQKISPQ